MIGRLEKTVFDSPDPRAPAAFRAAVPGTQVSADDGDAWQKDPQREDADIRVEDVDAAERAVVALGATRLSPSGHERGFRVFADPAGHPFCPVF